MSLNLFSLARAWRGVWVCASEVYVRLLVKPRLHPHPTPKKNQAANVMANWRDPHDPVARVVRRVFAFANDHAPGSPGEGYGLTVDGQEPFSVIQYNPGQEYRPHCDGSCDGAYFRIMFSIVLRQMLQLCLAPVYF